MNNGLHTNRWLWVGGLFVVLLTLVAHVRGLQGQFLEWDDATHITQNPAIRALTFENLRILFTQPIAKLYCPLTWLSFALDYQVWGRDPFGYHLTNLLLHLANTALVLVLVFRVLRKRTETAAPVAVLTAAIFGVHPLHVESIAWATERKDLLFALFYLLALLSYLRWLDTRKVSFYWVCFGLFVASAFSKATAVTLPFVLLLFDHFLAKRKAWEEKIPFFAVSLAITAITFMAQASGQGETVAGPDVISLWDRLGLLGYCSLFYAGKFFWPFHLSAVYPAFDEMGWNMFTGPGYLAAFAIVTVIIRTLRRRWPAVLPSWFFYLITLSPTMGFIPVGIHVVADRFSYLPLIGLALPVSMAIVLVVESFNRSRATQRAASQSSIGRLIVCSLVAAVMIILTGLSIQRTPVWENTETLFLNALRENPRCLPAHINLTVWYTRCKQFDKAIDHGQQAVAIAPNGIPGRKNLAYAFINADRRRDAIHVLRPLAQQNVGDPAVWRMLAECFESLGDSKNAETARQAMRRCEGLSTVTGKL
jgi:protein O-mannosyl-transferase